MLIRIDHVEYRVLISHKFPLVNVFSMVPANTKVFLRRLWPWERNDLSQLKRTSWILTPECFRCGTLLVRNFNSLLGSIFIDF